MTFWQGAWLFVPATRCTKEYLPQRAFFTANTIALQVSLIEQIL